MVINKNTNKIENKICDYLEVIPDKIDKEVMKKEMEEAIEEMKKEKSNFENMLNTLKEDKELLTNRLEKTKDEMQSKLTEEKYKFENKLTEEKDLLQSKFNNKLLKQKDLLQSQQFQNHFFQLLRYCKYLQILQLVLKYLSHN